MRGVLLCDVGDEHQLVALVEADAKLRWRADDSHLPKGHDADAIAQRVGFLERMRRQDERLVALRCSDGVPQLAA